MTMRLPYYTEADPTLPHQVVFIEDGHQIYISCNCLRVLHGTTYGHDKMGRTENLEQSRAFYNDPANHRKPFGEGDAAKW